MRRRVARRIVGVLFQQPAADLLGLVEVAPGGAIDFALRRLRRLHRCRRRQQVLVQQPAIHQCVRQQAGLVGRRIRQLLADRDRFFIEFSGLGKSFLTLLEGGQGIERVAKAFQRRRVVGRSLIERFLASSGVFIGDAGVVALPQQFVDSCQAIIGCGNVAACGPTFVAEFAELLVVFFGLLQQLFPHRLNSRHA